MGPPGPTGPEGPPARGGLSIIPFASGSTVELSTNANGSPNKAALIGFGASGTSPRLIDNTIDLANAHGLTNFAFSLPRSGIIDAITAHFTITGNSDSQAAIISAELYSAPINSNIFRPLDGSLQVLTATGNSSNIRSGIINTLELPVESETRILMVFKAESTNRPLFCNFAGYASAGISII